MFVLHIGVKGGCSFSSVMLRLGPCYAAIICSPYYCKAGCRRDTMVGLRRTWIGGISRYRVQRKSSVNSWAKYALVSRWMRTNVSVLHWCATTAYMHQLVYQQGICGTVQFLACRTIQMVEHGIFRLMTHTLSWAFHRALAVCGAVVYGPAAAARQVSATACRAYRHIQSRLVDIMCMAALHVCS